MEDLELGDFFQQLLKNERSFEEVVRAAMSFYQLHTFIVNVEKDQRLEPRVMVELIHQKMHELVPVMKD